MLSTFTKYFALKLLPLLLVLLLLASLVPAQKPVTPEPPPIPVVRQTKREVKKLSVNEGLEDYLDRAEIRPHMIVNNREPGVDQPEALGKHRVKWIRSEEENSKVIINGDVIALKGKLSLNHLRASDNDSGREVNFANEWKQVRLYNFGERELIWISMFYHPCTGIGCGVEFVLVYDLKTKNASFFGSYRSFTEAKIFDLGNDGTIDFLASTYSELTPADALVIVHRFNAYTMDKNTGKFAIRKVAKGAPYFLKRVYEEYGDLEDDKKFEMNWFETIRFERVVIR